MFDADILAALDRIHLALEALVMVGLFLALILVTAVALAIHELRRGK